MIPEPFWDEMEKIAEALEVHPFLAAFDLLVDHQEKSAFVTYPSMKGPGSSGAMGSTNPVTSGPASAGSGSTNIPGMSIHCNSCGEEMSKKEMKAGHCPHCGEKTRPHTNLKGQASKESMNNGEDETGGDAAEQQAMNEHEGHAYIKGAAVQQALINPATLAAMKEYGKGALGIGGAVGVTKTMMDLEKKMKQPQMYQQQTMQRPAPMYKAARAGNPIFRIRKFKKGKPSDTIARLQKKTRYKRL